MFLEKKFRPEFECKISKSMMTTIKPTGNIQFRTISVSKFRIKIPNYVSTFRRAEFKM